MQSGKEKNRIEKQNFPLSAREKGRKKMRVARDREEEKQVSLPR